MSVFRSPALADAALKQVPPRRVAPSGVLHFTLSVSDLDRSRKFYEEVVGCSFVRRNDTMVFMRCGDDNVILSRSGYHAPQNRDRDTLIHHAFMLKGEDFDAAVAHVDACGVEILLYEDAGHRSFPGRHVYFHDPDGNAIEFVDLREAGQESPASDGGERRAKSHLSGASSEK